MLIHVLVQEVASRLLEEIRLRGEKKKRHVIHLCQFLCCGWLCNCLGTGFIAEGG